MQFMFLMLGTWVVPILPRALQDVRVCPILFCLGNLSSEIHIEMVE